MKVHHRRHHWIAVAVALAAFLLTLNEAHGAPEVKGSETAAAAERGVTPSRDIKPQRDQSLAKNERSAVNKGKRAAKRVAKRSRTGVGEIDSGKSAAR